MQGAGVEIGRFDAACRVEVLDAVARADPTFGTARAEPVLVTAVESTRSLRRLARVVRSDPEVLSTVRLPTRRCSIGS